MIRTILFDLDGTLLPMDQDIYVREYIGKLARFFGEDAEDAERVKHAMIQAVVAVMKDQSGQNNEELFWSVYTAASGRDLRQNPEKLFEFYAVEHPKLCKAVAQGRNSLRPVEILKEKGYRVVLATNPLFPRMATYQRMSWAGFAPSDFEWVTTYENSRNCKPHGAYFQDLLEQIGEVPENCLMVGNDTRDDMLAAELGMEVYLVTDYLIHREEWSIDRYRHGDFAAFEKFAESLPSLV
ncbi:MAG: HAD family hydrolase [Clostridiales bacterium]|nr:HAD family hydrolase [Clostridiales bacterium]